MTKPDFPGGLAAITDKYDAILCDVWGVLHNGRYAFEEAYEALVRYRDRGGAVCLITGVPPEAFDDCVTSGDATREVLKERAGEVFHRMGADEGWENDKFLYEGLDLQFGSAKEAHSILCIGLEDQANDHPDDYRDRLAEAADRGLDMICANPDIKVRIGEQLYWCAGALAKVFEEEGGKVIYPGKPHDPIYDLALSKLSDLGVEPSANRILCIGDSPATDIKGAMLRGYDSLYVGTGLQQHGSDFSLEATELLASYQAEATYAMPGLAW